MRKKLKSLLAKILLWAMSDATELYERRYAELDRRCSYLSRELERLKVIIDDGTIAIDHHVKSHSWIIVGIRKQNKPDLVAMYGVDLKTAENFYDFLKRHDKALVDTSPTTYRGRYSY